MKKRCLTICEEYLPSGLATGQQRRSRCSETESNPTKYTSDMTYQKLQTISRNLRDSLNADEHEAAAILGYAFDNAQDTLRDLGEAETDERLAELTVASICGGEAEPEVKAILRANRLW